MDERQRSGREPPRAVVTHSSGNHGQALACAARAEGNLCPRPPPAPRGRHGVNAQLVPLGRMEVPLLNL